MLSAGKSTHTFYFMNSFDCEILPTDETLRRGIAGFKAKIVRREADKIVVRVWDDFLPGWKEPQYVRPEEVRAL